MESNSRRSDEPVSSNWRSVRASEISEPGSLASDTSNRSKISLDRIMTLEESLEEAKRSSDLFFSNKFEESCNILKPWIGSSLYHTVGNSVFQFVEALLVFDPEKMGQAGESLKSSVNLCDFYRRKRALSETVLKLFKRSHVDNYTSKQMHAELCFAESLLLKTILNFFEDGSLLRFINAGMKIRACFKSYQECEAILNTRHWKEDDAGHKVHFESGVRLGIGAFNLVVSLLNRRAVKILEFIGFSGSKEVGLEELLKGAQQRNGLRHSLIILTLLTYNLLVVHDMSYCDGDTELCEELLREELKFYSEGACFLYFRGRLEFVRCNISEANKWYLKSQHSQNAWPQLHHLCFWEMMWTYSILQDWQNVCLYADILLINSKWSKTVYCYQKASAMLMKSDLSPEELKVVDELMTEVPKHKHTFFAGKSIPFEKFCIKRSERYLSQRKLVLPCVELLYIFNQFKIIGKRLAYSSSFHQLIEDALSKVDQNPEEPYYADNKALLLLMKGSCLRHMKKNEEAEVHFNNILELEKYIQEDNHLPPNAIFELAIICRERGKTDQAIDMLLNLKNGYTNYLLKNRLDFKIHSLLMDLGYKNPTDLSHPSMIENFMLDSMNE